MKTARRPSAPRAGSTTESMDYSARNTGFGPPPGEHDLRRPPDGCEAFVDETGASREIPAFHHVTAALILSRGRIFIAQRPPRKSFGLYWEFPGGKTDPGEGLENCLSREIREELSWNVEVGARLGCVSVRRPELSIDLHAFWCALAGGELRLREHVSYYWAYPEELRNFRFTEADTHFIPSIEAHPFPPAPAGAVARTMSISHPR